MIDDSIWAMVQQRLGYTDEEMALFKSRPENLTVMEKTPALMGKTIVVEVVESHGCNSLHKVGDRLYFDSAGNLLTKQAPSRVCVFGLKAIAPLVVAMQELFYAGVDPNRMIFKRTGCPDVGVRCGGWGHVVFEIRMEDR